MDITNSKRENYANIETLLNDHFGVKMNVLDFYEFLEQPSNELIIILNTFCILFFDNHYKRLPENLDKNDVEWLSILIKPIRSEVKDPDQLVDKLRTAINLESKRDLEKLLDWNDPFSLDSHCHNSSTTHIEQNLSDNDISNSFNQQDSFAEPSSKTRDYIYDSSFQKNVSRLSFTPSNSTTKTPSSKTNKFQKLQEDKKCLQLEKDDLWDELCKSNDTITKLNQENKKLKKENLDKTDLLEAEKQKYTLIIAEKEKELDRNQKDLKTSKKLNDEKTDDIEDLTLSNNELNLDIDRLQDQLKFKEFQCKELFENNESLHQKNLVLQVENEKLKNDKINLQNQFEELQQIRSSMIDPESLLNSPAIKIEEGESLDIINQMKFAEMKEEYEKTLQECKKDVENLNSLLSLEKENSENYKFKFTQQNEEIKMLREKNDQLEMSLENHKNMDRRSAKETQVGNIVENLRSLLSDKYFTNDDKTFLIKSASNFLDIDLSNFEQNHEFCEKEISTLEQKIKYYKEELERNTCQLYDQEKELNNAKFEFSNLQRENSEKQRLWQRDTTKLRQELRNCEETINDHNLRLLTKEEELNDTKIALSSILLENSDLKHLCTRFKINQETEDRMKEALFSVIQERNQANLEIIDLKKELSNSERDLEKSNQEFNRVQIEYHESLQVIKEYEKIIIEVTERERKVLVDTGCQTGVRSRDANQMYEPMDKSREISYDKFLWDLVNQKSSDSGRKSRILRDTIRASRPHDTDNNSSRKKYNQELFVSPEVQQKLASSRYVSEYKGSTLHERNYDRSFSGTCNPGDPQRGTLDQFSFENQNQKTNSPAVKLPRLHQMISRNLQQPNHLKSSYPIETQAADQRYLVDCLENLKKEPFENDKQENYLRNSKNRNILPDNHTNLRPSIHNQGAVNYTNNSISDELIKASKLGRLNARASVFSEHSKNSISTVRNTEFRSPAGSGNIKIRQSYRNLGPSDRENLSPETRVNKELDKELKIFTACKFDIPNSPLSKSKGNRKVFLNRNQKKSNGSRH